MPTALLEAYGNDRIRTARMLGRLSSCGALVDVLLTPQAPSLATIIPRLAMAATLSMAKLKMEYP